MIADIKGARLTEDPLPCESSVRQQVGLGLDQIRTFSRHRTLQTMLIYRDAREQMTVQRQLVDVVAGTLTAP